MTDDTARACPCCGKSGYHAEAMYLAWSDLLPPSRPSGLLREAAETLDALDAQTQHGNLAYVSAQQVAILRAALAATPVYDQESLEALNNLPLRFGTPANPAGLLREAAAGYVALHEPDGECNGKCSAWTRLRAALAAPPPERECTCDSPDGHWHRATCPLDVERLARAIRTAELRSQMQAEKMGAQPAETGPMPDWYRAYAADVAVEYARLREDVP